VARKTKLVTITAPGRDKSKQFLITEMAADQGERWAMRALLALSRGGIEIPEGLFEQGFAGLASVLPYALVIGLRSLHGAQWAEVEPLLEEMMNCVQWVPPGTNADPALLQPIWPGANAQTEEVGTRLLLRREVLGLHMDPSLADALSTSGANPASAPSNS
jgi:hypothetical protein